MELRLCGSIRTWNGALKILADEVDHCTTDLLKWNQQVVIIGPNPAILGKLVQSNVNAIR